MLKKLCLHTYRREAELVMPPSYHSVKVGRKEVIETLHHPIEMVYSVCSKCGKEKLLYKRELHDSEIEVYYGNR